MMALLFRSQDLRLREMQKSERYLKSCCLLERSFRWMDSREQVQRLTRSSQPPLGHSEAVERDCLRRP